MKDLTNLMEDIVEVYKKHFPEDNAAIGIAFTLEQEDYKKVNWVTNVSRENGIMLFQDTANKMAFGGKIQ